MSGQLYRFTFADDSATVTDIIYAATISEIDVLIKREGCENVVAKYIRPVDCLVAPGEAIFEVLNEVDFEFFKLDFFERDSFRIRVTGVEELGLPR